MTDQTMVRPVYRPTYGPYHRALIRAHQERAARLSPKEKPSSPPPESDIEPDASAAASPVKVIEFGKAPRHVVVQQLVSAAFGVERADLVGPSRRKVLCVPRHVAMLICSVAFKMSLPQIGRLYGRDHTTVINALARVRGRMAVDDEFRLLVDGLLSQVVNGRREDEKRGGESGGGSSAEGGGGLAGP